MPGKAPCVPPTHPPPLVLPQVRLLEYDPDREMLVSVASWIHPDEVWDIASSPAASSSFVTVHNHGGACVAGVWGPSRVQGSGRRQLSHGAPPWWRLRPSGVAPSRVQLARGRVCSGAAVPTRGFAGLPVR